MFVRYEVAKSEHWARKTADREDAIDRRNFTVLHKIVLGLVQKNLESQLAASTALIDAMCTFGYTALSLAAFIGDSAPLQTLLRYGADMHKSDMNIHGFCAIHFAAHAWDTECLQLLVDNGADVDVLDNHRQSPLMHAMLYKDDVCYVKILLDAGADMHMIGDNGWSSMDRAVYYHRYNAVSMLTDYGHDSFDFDRQWKMLGKTLSGNNSDLLDLLQRFLDAPAKDEEAHNLSIKRVLRLLERRAGSNVLVKVLSYMAFSKKPATKGFRCIRGLGKGLHIFPPSGGETEPRTRPCCSHFVEEEELDHGIHELSDNNQSEDADDRPGNGELQENTDSLNQADDDSEDSDDASSVDEVRELLELLELDNEGSSTNSDGDLGIERAEDDHTTNELDDNNPAADADEQWHEALEDQ